MLQEPFSINTAPFFQGWGFAPPWFFKKCRVQKKPQKLVNQLRALFVRDIRDSFFKQACASVSAIAPSHVFASRWSVHHVVPLGLGGTNECLALAHATPHGEIHAFINLQTKDMAIGEIRDIWIPMQTGLVWDIEKAFVPSALPLRKRTRPTRIPEEAYKAASAAFL